MSHDFEPTDAEKEMLSYMKDIEVNRKQTELGEIISGAILDGQNQIHDLYKEKATSQQIEYRMRRAYIYWMDRLNKANDHQLQKAREEAQAEYKQFVLNVLDGVDIADGQCNTKAIRFAIQSRTIHSELDQDKEDCVHYQAMQEGAAVGLDQEGKCVDCGAEVLRTDTNE